MARKKQTPTPEAKQVLVHHPTNQIYPRVIISPTPFCFLHTYAYKYSFSLIQSAHRRPFAMASRIALLFLSLLLATVFRSSFAATKNDDILIRQVVNHGEDGVVDDNSLLDADHHFSIFKRKFAKAYTTQEEHDYRFSVFKANLRRARRHQKLDPSAVHGVTQFSDLTPREFRRQFHGINRRLRFPSDAQKAPILPTNDLPTDFDWRDHGAVTPVKNQVRAFIFRS